MKKTILTTLTILSLGVASSLQAQTILVDFGASNLTTPGNWNNLVLQAADNGNQSIANLINDQGANTGISLAVTGFHEPGAQTMASDPGVPTPTTANLDYFRSWQGATATDPGTIGTVTLTGLATDTEYSMTLFGSRDSNGGDANRGGQYRLTGAGIIGGTQTLNIVTRDNTSTFGFNFTTTSIAGSVILEVQGYNFTTNAIGIGGEARGSALSSMDLTVIPEPSSAALLTGGLALLVLLRRRSR